MLYILLTLSCSLSYSSYVSGRLHSVLWWVVTERCQVVDKLVRTRLSHLRLANLSALQLGVPASYYTPLPAAVLPFNNIFLTGII